MVRSSARGFTLLEMILASAMLGLLILAIFRAFDYGANAFRRATSKQDAQAAIRSVYGLIRDDLRKTHYTSVSQFPALPLTRVISVDGKDRHRDGLCMASLKDWSNTDSFDDINGLPMWDRYVLYYGTMEGRLIRSNIDPDTPDFSPAPFADLDGARHMNENPDDNSLRQSSYRIMTTELLEFKVELNPARDTVSVLCLLESKNKKMNEISLTVYPQNTWPKGENR